MVLRLLRGGFRPGSCEWVGGLHWLNLSKPEARCCNHWNGPSCSTI